MSPLRIVMSSVALALTLSPLAACELAEHVEEGIEDLGDDPDNTPDEGTTDISGGPDAPAPPTPDPGPPPAPPTPPTPDPGASPTPATPSTPKAPLDVELDVVLRIVVVNGQMIMEADCRWHSGGAANIVVDIQMKSDLMPNWTDMLTDQPAIDVGSFMVSGGRQDYHFRAVAQDLDDPEHTGTSAIITIRQ